MVFLFNVGGYYIVLFVLQYQTNQEILSRLAANQLADDEAIFLKIPVTLPYITSDDDYRSATGEIEYQGEFYKLIKQKQIGDTLIVICIKNHEAKRLVKKIMDYANLSNDLPVQSRQAQSLLNKLIKEYTSFQQKNISLTQCWVITNSHNTISFFKLNTFELSVQVPPPKSVS